MLPPIAATFKCALVQSEGPELHVSTGSFFRTWKWTGNGFGTKETGLTSTGPVWKNDNPECDWQLPDCSEPGKAELVSLKAEPDDDEGFTSEHICATAIIRYADQGYELKFTAWAYPDSHGIRTQLFIRRTGETAEAAGKDVQGRPTEARIERIPSEGPNRHRRLFGFYNETQHRNDTHLDIIKEEVLSYPLSARELAAWPSVFCMEDSRGGIALVQESHKCVNQEGHATGEFICSKEEGLASCGWGLRIHEISEEDWTPAWAYWVLAWKGSDFERQAAFRTFDTLRYPIDPDRDIYIQANTWGSTETSVDARLAAHEESVLKELEVCADLGIDVLQIDDGWQKQKGSSTWVPDSEKGECWLPHKSMYREGWSPVRKRAEELGVRLGLWCAAQPVSLEELKQNYEQGGFLQYKLDFAKLSNRNEIDELMGKVREFISWTGHKTRVNWDVTENTPRYGYFFARDYGPIYLENRKPVRPLWVVYRPHTVLRDLWQLARYLNLHRFQGSVQNVDMVDKNRSDAHLHPHSYAVAIPLMSIPLFFLETKYYSDEARNEIRPLLAEYKKHRELIYRGQVHPIGNKPDNGSWTGFQCHLEDEKCGFLTVFRERCSIADEAALELGWLRNQNILLTNLLDGTSCERNVDHRGEVQFVIEEAPGFLFLKYTFGE